MRKGVSALILFVISLTASGFMVANPVSNAIKVETMIIPKGDLIQTVLLEAVVGYQQEQPCVSFRDGVVKAVYIRHGDTVHKGDLLIRLDTSAEEETLAALYEMRHAQKSSMDQWQEAAAALNPQTELAWLNTEKQLRSAIQAGQIRAAADGVAEAVYVQENDWITQSSLLGIICGTEKQIIASASADIAARLIPGAAAEIKAKDRSISAVVSRMGPPDATGSQRIYLSPVDEELDTGLEAGERLQTEIVSAIQPDCALIPLSAVDAEGRIWIAENGRVFPQTISIEKTNRQYASSGLEWAGKSVVLFPQQHALEEGMRVIH